MAGVIMNLQQVIDGRKFLTEEQHECLITILAYKQRLETKQALRDKLRNKFFTIFDETGFAKQFFIKDNTVEFKPRVPADRAKELKGIRDRILLFTI